MDWYTRKFAYIWLRFTEITINVVVFFYAVFFIKKSVLKKSIQLVHIGIILLTSRVQISELEVGVNILKERVILLTIFISINSKNMFQTLKTVVGLKNIFISLNVCGGVYPNY